MKEIDDKLLHILACPACEERPHVELKDNRLYCQKCGRAYPIRDGIPVMLVDEATMEDQP
ncbi:MAG: Trm112 family protein [Armatimonadetes bacterium]|nr:Trm112 family protein [Armatimonadota bacterium]